MYAAALMMLALMPRCHPRYLRCRCVIGGIDEDWMLDDDDDYDDDDRLALV